MKRVIATVLAAISLAQPAHATWNGPPEQWPEHARWTCEVMMKDLDGALEAGLSLHNSDFSLVNWVKDHLGYADRAAKLIMLRGANDLVNLAGGGREEQIAVEAGMKEFLLDMAGDDPDVRITVGGVVVKEKKDATN